MKFSTAVVALVLALVTTEHCWCSASSVLALSMLNVDATSAAVNGLPSFLFTPLRMVSVSVLPPLEKLSPVASMGIGAWAELSVLKMNSGSL